jgi:hypothetical protein
VESSDFPIIHLNIGLCESSISLPKSALFEPLNFIIHSLITDHIYSFSNMTATADRVAPTYCQCETPQVAELSIFCNTCGHQIQNCSARGGQNQTVGDSTPSYQDAQPAHPHSAPAASNPPASEQPIFAENRSMEGWWHCCENNDCRNVNNPELSPEMCFFCGHLRCITCQNAADSPIENFLPQGQSIIASNDTSFQT